MNRNFHNPALTGIVTYVCLIWLTHNASQSEIVIGYLCLVCAFLLELGEMRRQARMTNMVMEIAERDMAERKAKETKLGPDA